jgi:exopolyphosphatase/guanosine-5'-triphosphate,3'-diphosphate pyrophosphatase
MRKNTRPVAVIDIGSNAVRFVVYHDLCRVPVQLHNERNICGLGKTLNKTGKLNPDGVTAALDSIARFAALISAMKIKTVLAVATAALREAEDGPWFVETVRERFGLDINVISGEEEARLSALGVVANHGAVDGLIGDFGGGSLELIGIEKGRIKTQNTLPVGALRILSHDTTAARLDYIDQHLKTLDLSKFRGQSFYVLGGAWRSLARAHIFMEKYPIQVLDNYRLNVDEAIEFTTLIARQNTKSLERMAGLPQRRVRDMPAAALVLKRVLETAQPSKLVFSGTGLREGLLYDQLSSGIKQKDPLISACREIGRETSRFSTEKELLSLAKWIQPLFPDPDAPLVKTLQAASLLSDVGWFEHEDHRPRHAYLRILNMPLYGMSHRRRAILALAVFVRHKGYLRTLGRGKPELTEAAQKMVNRAERDEAVLIGLAMRLAYTLTGGALTLLKHGEISVTDTDLNLTLTGRHTGIKGEVVQDLLNQIAALTGHAAHITVKNDSAV